MTGRSPKAKDPASVLAVSVMLLTIGVAGITTMRPWSVVASIGRLEGEGKLRGDWGWDRARRCLRWQAEPAGPSEGGGGARFSTHSLPRLLAVRPSDQETHTV